jgi:hypothetical protein
MEKGEAFAASSGHYFRKPTIEAASHLALSRQNADRDLKRYRYCSAAHKRVRGGQN